MRKTSHDGGDSTSITSGVENEIKKSAMKPKKSSLKRKAPNFSQESDDTVIEPLLQRDKEKSEPQSAKFFAKGKTDSLQNKESDNKAKTATTTGFCGTTESLLSFKDPESNKSTTTAVAPLHNYMNTNVFNSRDNVKANVTTKSQILVEIDSSKQSSYTPSPLIFTTAKIHTDAKTKQMEPVHVTPVPILSTIEVNMSKGGSVITNEKKISNGSSVVNPVYSPMPLSKGRDEKVTLSSFSTVFSPTINKDAFVKTVPTTLLANITTAQTNSMKITLPSATSNSMFMKSNTTEHKDKVGEVKDIKNEQTLQNDQHQPITFSSDSTKNNVTVKTMMSSSGKPTEITTTSDKTTQGANSQTQKLVSRDNISVNVSSNDPHSLLNNNRAQTSQSAAGLSSSAKSTSTSSGNKQLQRQKTTTEEISDIRAKAEPNEHSENSSAKMSSPNSKNIDSVSIKNVSANNTQITNTNKTVNTVSKTTSIANTIKPVDTNVATVKMSPDVSSKPLTTNVTSNTTKIVSPTSTNSASIITPSNVSTTSTISSINVTKAPVDVTKTSIPTSNITKKSPDITSTQSQPNSNLSKILHEKAPVVKSSTAKPVVSLTSDKNKPASIAAVKTNSGLGKSTATTVTQPQPASTAKITTPKTSVTTSVKATSASSFTSTSTKPSSSTSQVSSSTPLLSSSSVTVKAPSIATSIPKAVPVDPIATMAQNITTSQGSSKQTTAAGANAISKTSSAMISGKSSAANSSALPAFSNTGIKSPNNNTSHTFDAVKPPMTSIPKTESVKILPKTSESSSTNNSTSAGKSQKDISSSTTTTKDPVASVKKSAATKTSVATKSPVSSVNKSTVVTPTTVSSSEASLASTTKKSASGAKTGSATTTKTPSVTKSTKAPDVTSVSSVTTSATATKPATTSVTQVSANKSVDLAGSSVPSTTPVLRPSESDKKGGSKSSENNKDGKVSKA